MNVGIGILAMQFLFCKYLFQIFGIMSLQCTLIKKKIKFSSYIRKFSVEQLQSLIWLTASSYIGKYLRISSYIRKPFLICNDFATAPLWISLYMRQIWFSFYQCRVIGTKTTHLSSENEYAILYTEWEDDLCCCSRRRCVACPWAPSEPSCSSRTRSLPLSFFR